MFDFVIKYTIIFCTGGDMKNIATKTNKLLLRCSRIILAALSVFLLTSLFVAQDSCAAELFSELITKGYVPFAITEFGDVICESKEETIYLYKHESDEFEYITENIRKFINEKLY